MPKADKFFDAKGAAPDLGVHQAAVALADAIRNAKAAGYRVQAAFQPEDLESIAVSDTAKSLGQTVKEVPVIEELPKD